MNIQRLRYRILLTRAVPIALVLEAALLLPQEAWAGKMTASQFNSFLARYPKTDQCSLHDGKDKFGTSIPQERTTAKIVYFEYTTWLREKSGNYRRCSFTQYVHDGKKGAYQCSDGVVSSIPSTCSSYFAKTTSKASLQKTAANDKDGTSASGGSSASAGNSKGQSKSGTGDSTVAAKSGKSAASASGAGVNGSSTSSSDRSGGGEKTAAAATTGNKGEAGTKNAATQTAGNTPKGYDQVEGHPDYYEGKDAAGNSLGYYKKMESPNTPSGYDYVPHKGDLADLDSDRVVTLPNGQTYSKNSDGKYNWGKDENTTKQLEARKEWSRKQKEDREKASAKGADPCYDSAKLGTEFACKQSLKAVKTAEIVNVVSQVGGQVAVQSMGNASYATAQQSGRMSDTHKEAAKLAKKTAKLQGVLGATNLYMHSKMGKHANRHKRNIQDLKNANSEGIYTAVGSDEANLQIRGDGVQDSIIEKWEMNERLGAMKPEAKYDAVIRMAESKNRQLQAEQMGVFQRTTESKEATKMEAAKQLAGMASSLMASRQAAKTAKLAAVAEGKTGQMVNPNFGVDPAELKRQMQQSAATSGDPSDSSANTGDTADLGSMNPNGADYNLGDGAGDPAGDTGPQRLPPGAFTASPGGGGPSGGGSGLGGGGGNAPPPPNQEESKASYAGNFEGNDRYEGTGTITKGVGKGNSGGAAGGDGGIDFNSLLAKFLPSGEEEQAPSVLETNFGGNRGIAAVNSAPSLLDSKADLFGRIHDLYQEKHSRGQIGNR